MSPYLTDIDDASDGDNELRNKFPHIDADPATLPPSLDPFTITTSNGFLPLHAPMVDLPNPFKPLIALMNEMSVVTADGSTGLLGTYQLGLTVDKGALPNLVGEIDKLVTAQGEPDMVAITAVFREYGFLASAYLLEPCWERWHKGLEGYGLGRQLLPKCIAGPLIKTAKILDIHPFISYAAAYALFNYRFADPAIGASKYNNLRLIRAFERGLDPASSEAGFILTHVDMVKYSQGLVKGAVDVLSAIDHRSERDSVNEGFNMILETMQLVEASMETMWANSRPKDYNTYRIFIFGITNQSMFPDGVVYEGENDNEPLFFRGESGANDSMIPLLDSLLEIPMPQNPLTDILKDFRSYRPKPHREFLAFVRRRADELGVREYAAGDVDTTVLYLRVLDHVRSFRWRHWLFAREYIIRLSSHPTATGGSPIVTWLPNQLFAVMDLMCSVWNGISEDDRTGLPQYVKQMMENVEEQRTKLKKEVEKWCQERGV